MGDSAQPFDAWRFIETTDQAIGVDDAEGNVVFANRAFRELFGLGEDEPLGSLADYVSPGAFDEVLRRHHARQRGDPEAKRFSFTAVRRDGSELTVEGSITELYDDGVLRGTVAVVRDVTASVEREQRTAEAEARYRTVFESAFDAMIVFEPVTERILAVNRRACELYGFEEDELVGRSLVSLSNNAVRGRAAVNRVMAEGTIDGLVASHVRSDGTSIVVECSASAIEYGGAPAILTVNRDVTERERIEQQLRHAQKMKAVVQLAAGVAHEYNNILATILAAAEELKELACSAQVDAILDSVIERSRSGSRVTEGLLTLARPQRPDAPAASLDSVILKLEHALRRLMPDGVALNTRMRAHGESVGMPVSDLERVLMNLVLNARDALGGQGSIGVSTRLVRIEQGRDTTVGALGPGDYVVLCVEDDGPGIPSEHVSRVFEPFYTTKPAGVGTGLGLAEVWALVEAAGGGIELRTSPAGTMFEVLVPVVRATTPARTPVSSVVPGAALDILVVDDEEILLAGLERGLQREGFRVRCASTPDAAMQCLREHEISVLVTDISLGPFDGIELARTARAEFDHLGIVLMSGFAHESPSDLEHAVFLGKPFGRAELVEAIRYVAARGLGQLARGAPPRSLRRVLTPIA